jgi:hypothetical protein
MPAPPLRELIMQDVFEAIRGIKRESGYNFTAYDVSRALTGPFENKRFPVVSVYEGDERGGIDNYFTYERFLTVVVEGWIKETRKGSLATDLNLLLADIETAVLEKPNRNQLAIDTELTDISPPIINESGEGEAGVIVFFTIHYRFTKFDPTTVVPR